MTIPNLNGSWHLHTEGASENPDTILTIREFNSHKGQVAGTEIGAFQADYAQNQAPYHPGGINPNPARPTFTGHVYNVPKRANSVPVISMVCEGVFPGSATETGYYYATFCGRMVDDRTIVGSYTDLAGRLGPIKLTRIH